MIMTAAQAMVECLVLENVEVVYGYPGAAICPFYDVLSASKIRHILVRNEQNGGHAANGYARISSRPGVCIATSGPGALNLITAIATAYMDSVPLVAITGQVSSELLGRDVFQEADITGAVEPFIKHSYLVKNAKDLPRIFKEAFMIASTGRPGPVLIDVPIDIQQQKIDFSYPDSVSVRSYKPSVKGHTGQIKKVCDAIASAKKPLICAGGGVFPEAFKDLRVLAQRCDIPVVTTMMGKGALPSEDRLYYGMIGMHGVKPANYAMNHNDLLIVIGARVGDRAVAAPGLLEKKTKIVHIDVDPAEIGKNMQTQIPVVGDAKVVLGQILECAVDCEHPEWTSELDEVRAQVALPDHKDGKVNPKAFVRRLSELAPEDNIVVADVGQNQIWSCNNFLVRDGRFLTSGGMGTMGYSVPAAVGAKLADPERCVIAICGDGAFQMQMNELGTICQHDIPVKIVVMKNNRLGMVRELQTNLYKDNQTAVSLDGSPDFTALSSAYGVPSDRVSNPGEIDEKIERMLKAKTPYLLEVDISETETSL